MWSSTYLVIQIVAGVFGGHAAASAMHDHGFGFVGHTLAGAVGGFLSGCFLQTLAVTMVSANGSINEHSVVTDVFLQVLLGAIAGAIAMGIGGIVKHGIDQHRSQKS